MKINKIKNYYDVKNLQVTLQSLKLPVIEIFITI